MMKISGADLHLLSVFDSVVRNGGFSAAQAELGLSQPTISNHITALETRLGVILCQRGRRGFQLTDKGRQVHEIAVDLLRRIDVHSMSLTALKHLSREFEATGASLKVPFYVTFLRVTLPCCLPTIINIWGYLFVNAMTTVAAVIFLYSARTQVAAITIVNWNTGGALAPSAAMSTVLLITSASVWLLRAWVSSRLARRMQAGDDRRRIASVAHHEVHHRSRCHGAVLLVERPGQL